MKVIILAAGQGTRLRPYTNDRPKCMVELAGKPLLHHQLDTLYSAGISSNQIALVGGYLKDKLNAPDIKLYTNENFEKTNMVGTLFCAEEFMQSDEDLLICYGDIIYQCDVLTALLNTDGDIALAADKEWKRLWSLRMDEPLDDAETFKIENGNVIELGKKPQNYADIDAQYMGLIKISANKINDFINFYHNL
ncbi:NTP transferase domain-containing protein, partial [Providencia rettgeri]|uniref:phosphocholine cytidylyltransferase family protein n=2 Tax=Morganellaceae TaxID=1903414 RepID=UPI001EE6FE02